MFESIRTSRRCAAFLVALVLHIPLCGLFTPAHADRIKDIATVSGVRSNQLFGYGIVVGLDGSGPADVGDLDLADAPLVLVVGSEGKGLSRLVAQRCDVVARIPITGPAESLNAGIAASIALYAVSQQRQARQ